MSERSEQLNSKGVAYLQEKDYVSAIKYFNEALRLDNNINAAYNLGYCLFYGYGVEKDYRKALQYFQLFTKLKGNLANNAMYLSGIIYDNGGYGVKSNKEIAKRYYYKAAENGHSWALLQFGRMMQLEGDYSNAKEYIKTAMETSANDYVLQKEGKRLLKWNRIGRFL